MSGRCKSCNCVLSEDEMVHKWPGTPEYSDLCFTCMSLMEDEQDNWWDEVDILNELNCEE